MTHLHETDASSLKSHVDRADTAAETQGGTEQFQDQAARSRVRSQSSEQTDLPPTQASGPAEERQTLAQGANVQNTLKRSKSSSHIVDYAPSTMPSRSDLLAMSRTLNDRLGDLETFRQNAPKPLPAPVEKEISDLREVGQRLLELVPVTERITQALVTETSRDAIDEIVAHPRDVEHLESPTSAAGGLEAPSSAAGASTSADRAEEVDVDGKVVHSAPKRSAVQMARDTAIEVGMETLIQSFSFFVGGLIAAPINRRTEQQDETKNVLAHVVTLATISVFIMSVIEDAVRSNRSKRLDLEAVLGRALVPTAPLGLYIAAICKGTLSSSGVPNTRAVATVVVNQLVNRIVAVKTHRNPLNKDDLKDKAIDLASYGTAWMLVSSGAGFKNYVTGSSGLVASEALKSNLVGILNTSLAFGAAEGMGRVLPGSVRTFFRDRYGRMVPVSVSAPEDASDQALREATKTQVGLGDELKWKDIPNELWQGTKSAATTVLFYETVFNGLGLEGMVGASDPNPLSPAFKQAAIDGGTFGVYLPIVRASGLSLRPENKYRPYEQSREMTGSSTHPRQVDDV